MTSPKRRILDPRFPNVDFGVSRAPALIKVEVEDRGIWWASLRAKAGENGVNLEEKLKVEGGVGDRNKTRKKMAVKGIDKMNCVFVGWFWN